MKYGQWVRKNTVEKSEDEYTFYKITNIDTLAGEWNLQLDGDPAWHIASQFVVVDPNDVLYALNLIKFKMDQLHTQMKKLSTITAGEVFGDGNHATH